MKISGRKYSFLKNLYVKSCHIFLKKSNPSMKIKNLALSALLIAGSLSLSAQGPTENWHHLDMEKDGVQGMSTIKAYEELLKGKKSTTVVVAVIDSGIEEVHDDLKNVMWVNEGEIPGNGIDDDKNGYIDDIHGWNFIGGAKGEINQDNLEITRLYRMYMKKYEGKSADDISKKDKADFKRYQDIKTAWQESVDNAAPLRTRYSEMLRVTNLVIEKLDGSEQNTENINGLGISGEGVEQTLSIIVRNVEAGRKLEDLAGSLQGGVDYFSGQLDYYYNVDFDPRNIIGDDYSNAKETRYGNNTYEGPDASHGTHVGGIIGAERGNGVGMDGVADNVRIMTIRAVPDGDERDKDVAAAIRYAVDNGASVINMSFGKAYSWNKDIVNKAVKYAMKKDVLLVHAAGNSNQDNDTTDNFPNDSYKKNPAKKASNWLEIGALDWKGETNSPARFSNYGENNVDVFAPGVDIYSTTPEDTYEYLGGTSMAAPNTAGVAAMLRSYYPKLSANEVKNIIMKSGLTTNTSVILGGDTEKQARFNEVSKSGEMVNMYNAFKLAELQK
jgi:cell wall-associated protease